MREGVLYKKATPWVSYSVLVGGLISSIILFLLVRIEGNVEFVGLSTKVDLETYLQDN